MRWWWGFPSSLEINLLCRLANEPGELTVSDRWREQIAPALSGNDVSFAEFFWENLHLDFDALARHFVAFGERKGWTLKALKGWGAEDFMDYSIPLSFPRRLSPPKRWIHLWANGALSWTPEYGLELHTAALGILGRNEELQHRFWRGQATLLLPFIDGVRLDYCNYLTRVYGSDWPYRWERPVSAEEDKAVRETPLACQLGHLTSLLRGCRGLQTEQKWFSIFETAREIRNDLAHYRPISWQKFDRLFREIEAYRKKP